MENNSHLKIKITALEQLLDTQEKTIIEQLDRLAQSEKSFRSMFELTSEGVALVDPLTYCFIAANPAMCSLLGYAENEFSELSPEDITPPEAKTIMRGAMRSLFNGKDVPDLEGVCLRKDGITKAVIMCCRQLDWMGKLVFYVTFKDITYLKTVQSALEQKNREILDLTNTITHDLKKPLAVLKNLHSLAKSGICGVPDAKGEEFLGLGAEALSYMEEMIGDLLTSAQLDAGEKTLTVEEFDLNALLKEILNRLKLLIEGKKVAVTVSPDLGKCSADRKGIVKVYMNLIGNALNYIGQGPSKKIEIGNIARDGEKIHFVRDNGIGIPDDTKMTLFQKFKRGSNVGDIAGTGLGLPIVKGIVEAHGGKIWVESALNEGSTFYFTLPRK